MAESVKWSKTHTMIIMGQDAEKEEYMHQTILVFLLFHSDQSPIPKDWANHIHGGISEYTKQNKRLTIVK